MDPERARSHALRAGLVVAGALLAGRVVAEVRTRRHRRALGEVAAIPGEHFDRASVAELPGPARRYLRHAIDPGTPCYRRADLRQAGEFRLGDRWVPISADERIAPDRGFVWRASVRPSRLLRLRGVDYYRDGRGGQRFSAWGLLPVVRDRGPAFDRSAAGRLAGESVFVPTALLPRAGAEWSAVDDRRARVTLPVRGGTESATLTVGDDGALERVDLDRYRGDGAGRTPFRVTVGECRRVDGVAVPASFEAAWGEGGGSAGDGDGFEPFLRARTTEVAFR